MKRISVIVPAYNMQNHIERTIRSILDHSDSSIEIVVVDDGSTDATASIVEELSKANNASDRVLLLTQENQGVSVARNKGIEKATGEYLIFCDADDVCMEGLFDELQPGLLDCTDMILWGYNTREEGSDVTDIAQSGEKLRDCYDCDLCEAFVRGKIKIRLGSFAIRKKLIMENGIQFTEGCKYGEDVEFICKCLIKKGTYSLISKELFVYIKRNGSAILRYDLNRFDAPKAIRRACDYIEQNTDNEQLIRYSRNTFLLKHIIYTVDAFIPYMSDKEKRSAFGEFFDNSCIESEIERIKREIIEYPAEFNRNKVRLFLLNRKIYMICFMHRGIGI